jgi:hypothetical protein
VLQRQECGEECSTQTCQSYTRPWSDLGRDKEQNSTKGPCSDRGLYQSAAQAAMEETLNKMKAEEAKVSAESG